MSNKGFTLLEIVIVIMVILVLTSMVLANQREGEKNFALLRSAQRLAQEVRNVEDMAMAGQNSPELFGEIFPAGGYGLYFEKDADSYILFADCDGDGAYDETGSAESCATATSSNPFPEIMETFSLESLVTISNITPSSPVSIVFFPPDPSITIEPLADEAVITLSFDDNTRDITINNIGLIDID